MQAWCPEMAVRCDVQLAVVAVRPNTGAPSFVAHIAPNCRSCAVIPCVRRPSPLDVYHVINAYI